MSGQNSKLKETLIKFLKKQQTSSSSLLLGLSGGPDSLALFYLLLEVRGLFDFKFAVAHVDHQWRKESEKEARILQELASTIKIPFHLKKLDPSKWKGNWELACRNERLAFFRALASLYGYRAVILGHHADDQAEVVLKRIFEGASFSAWKGLQSVIHFEGLELWRPLLKIRKKEILDWLTSRDLIPFEDSTNKDSRFLRGRMRQELMPFLNQRFGKEISPVLCRLGEEAGELEEFIREALEERMSRAQSTSSGSFFDFNQEKISLFALKQCIRLLCKRESISPSFSIVEELASLIQSRVANRKVLMQNREILVDRGRLWIPKQLNS